ncbi:tetratricopeptide repeat protein [Sneathiella marina]|uniref:Tetratricopeptide repeat protein n=1 Tax=Sneathiella marina TaxID=2950108 RepID=A0ABY4W2G0_9PROT|nr:tetratricopeptide repeat protein [Sneathiella marina]USG61132.1 tetratricopeptide repeat protein [Sneathiella marina]
MSNFKAMSRIYYICLLSIILAASDITHGNAQERDEQAEYKSCLTLIAREPEMAFESALAWRDKGGGFPARHCAALALMEMKKYRIAAPLLEELAEDLRDSGSPLVVAVLGQAANAWLLAEKYPRALAVASAALEFEPKNIELRIDRARIYAQTNDFNAAFDDLDYALKIDPTRSDALVFRGAAWRQLGNNERAMEDIDLALSLTPDLLAGLVERGILFRLSGKDNLARADWLKVLNLSPYSAAAETARINLEKLDVNIND